MLTSRLTVAVVAASVVLMPFTSATAVPAADPPSPAPMGLFGNVVIEGESSTSTVRADQKTDTVTITGTTSDLNAQIVLVDTLKTYASDGTPLPVFSGYIDMSLEGRATVTGAGYAAGTPIGVWLKSTLIATTVSDEAGAFAVDVTFPAATQPSDDPDFQVTGLTSRGPASTVRWTAVTLGHEQVPVKPVNLPSKIRAGKTVLIDHKVKMTSGKTAYAQVNCAKPGQRPDSNSGFLCSTSQKKGKVVLTVYKTPVVVYLTLNASEGNGYLAYESKTQWKVTR